MAGATVSISLSIAHHDILVAAINAYAVADTGLQGEPLLPAERVQRALWLSRVLYGRE